eukprot:Gregarina_sp_Poly_1__3171@NODE_18_length_21885_cov_39_980383_g16_i0_p6_GENE_NODE_18_length_21885_cov_39_980383_g16_i0NODE_18_length_21885_cov_39_980383_g16_i0_p6_ORF_typecomplete_len214_score23_07FHA/PF00498_26/2_8e12YopYscD_cpl/PF16697_5/5_5e07_NODE_18_length_21885_cov_39_980383_g16_i02124221808
MQGGGPAPRGGPNNLAQEAKNLTALLGFATDDKETKTIPEDVLRGPSLLMYSPPILVFPSFTAAQLRSNQQNVPPFEYMIGRSLQTLDQVPLTARRWFSRRHCVIQVHPAKFGRSGEVFFMLKDLRSANGTFLNGRAVPAGFAVPLHSGDLIGVSMTDGGAFMLGFRFVVNAVSERVWGGDAAEANPA